MVAEWRFMAANRAAAHAGGGPTWHAFSERGGESVLIRRFSAISEDLADAAAQRTAAGLDRVQRHRFDRKPAAASRARCAGDSAASAFALIQTASPDSAMQLPAKAACSASLQSTACGAWNAAMAAGICGSAKPRGHTTAARPASTASTTFAWYSPGARSNSRVARRPKASCIRRAPSASQRSDRPQ